MGSAVVGVGLIFVGLAPLVAACGAGLGALGGLVTGFALALLRSRLAKPESGESGADRAREAFLTRMSHELRTPLNAITGYSELLLEDPEHAKATRKDLRRIASASHHLLGLVESVLDLAQLEAGRFPVQVSEVNLGLSVDRAVRQVRYLAIKAGVEIRLDAVSPITLTTDSRMLGQILFHLLHNAVRFSKRGDTVRLSMLPSAVGVELAVQDEGIGMTERQLEKAFEPFHQADLSSVRGYDGAGVGLAVVRGMVEALGGELRVRSKPNQGTRVMVSLALESTNSVWESDDEPTAFAR